MNQAEIKYILNSPIIGYAHHRILVDEQGIPIDYEFLEVNSTFEILTGLKAEEIIGKSVKTALPGFGKSEFDWIGFYGEVALKGCEKEFEKYSEPLDRWYRVHVYSTKKYLFSTMFVDITSAKKQAEELEAFFVVNLDLLCIADLEGNFLKTNEAWSHILGYSTEELNQRKFLEFVHPDDMEATLVAMEYLGKGNDVIEFTNRYQCKDGSYRFIEWRSHPKGNLIYASARDITERILREKELIKEKKQVDLFFNQSLHGFFICMLDEPIEWNDRIDKKKMIEYVLDHQRITRVNQAMLDQYGAEEKEFIGKTIRDLFKHDLDHAREIWTGLFDKGKWHVETYEQKLDGTPIVIEGDYICLYDDKGRITGHFGVQMDVTELHRDKERLEQAMKQSSMYIWEVDGSGVYTYIGNGIENVLGYTPDELVGIKSCFDLLPKEEQDSARVAFEEMFKERSSFTGYEAINIAKNGGKVWLSTSGHPVFNYDGSLRGYRGTDINISELKGSQQQFQSLVNNIPGITYRCKADKDWTMLFMATQVDNITGYTAEELLGKAKVSYGTLIHKDDKTPVAKAVEEGIAADSPWEVEYRVHHRDGSIRWVYEKGTAIKDTTGELQHLDGFILDITERKSIENTLKESEERYHRALFGAGAGLWEWDMVNNTVFYSSQWKAMLGYEDHEVPNDFSGWKNLWHPDEVAFIEQKVNDYLEGKSEIYEVEHRLQAKDCTWRWVLTRGDIEKNSLGQPIRWTGTNVDITERKIAEEEIQKSKDFLTQTGRVARVGGWNFDNLTGEISWTDTICDIHEVPHGFTPTYEEMASFYTPDSWVKLENAIQESMSTGVSYDMELQITTAKGRLIWVRAIGNSERENGVCIRLFGVLQDISERKISEEKIKESESKLQSVLDEVEDVIWSVRMPDYKMFLVTPSVEEFYGYTIDEWMADSSIWQKVIHPEDQGLIPEIFRRLETEGFSDTEYRIITKQGVVKWIKSRAKFIFDEYHKPVRIDGFAQDITERKKAEEEIISAKQQAEAASRAKSEFLANMSHEIRTPLNGVIGFTELLKTTALSPIQQKYVDSANISGHTLLGIINDILDFSKIEAGMLQLERIQTDMVELLENTIGIVKYQADQKSLELILHIDPAMPRFAITDELRLKQVLGNLLSNAVKFTHKGKVELKILYSPIDSVKGKFNFIVRDTGIGITEGQKQKLFKAFSQADSSTTRKFGGTGLGLIISDRIVRELGGKIQVDSEPGKGSTFHFEIDMDVEDGEHIESTCPESNAIVSGKLKILIAEDVEMNMFMITSLITRMFPEAILHEAVNGLEAVQFVGELAPDLVLMDVQMPEMDGLEATIKIRELEKQTGEHVPIIALTAGAFKEEQERCFAAGMDDFLTKPVDPEEIKAVLWKYLSEKLQPNLSQIRNAEHFSKEILLERTLGSEDMVKQLVAMALLDFPKTLDQLKEAIREEDSKNIRALAHRFKGSSYSLNCSRLAEIASFIEQIAGDKRDVFALKEKYNELHAEWEIVKGMLEKS